MVKVKIYVRKKSDDKRHSQRTHKRATLIDRMGYFMRKWNRTVYIHRMEHVSLSPLQLKGYKKINFEVKQN